MATFLAVGAGVEQKPYILKARSLGHRVVAVDGNKNASGLKTASAAIVMDIRDHAAVVEVAASHKCDAVLPQPVGAVLATIGAVNTALGLKGPCVTATSRCTDKVLFFETARKTGISTPESALANTSADVLRLAKAYGYPVIIKPRKGSGSKGVFFAGDEPDLRSVLGQEVTARAMQANELLVQPAVIGREVGVDGVVIGDVPRVLLIRDKTITPPPARFATDYFAPATLPQTTAAAVTATLTAAARALGFTDCIFHADVIVDARERPWVLEISPRPAGFNLFCSMLPAVIGKDFAAAMIQYLAGEAAPAFEVAIKRHAMLRVITSHNAGALVAPQLPITPDNHEEVLNHSHLANDPAGGGYMGHILLTAQSRAAVIQRMQSFFHNNDLNADCGSP